MYHWPRRARLSLPLPEHSTRWTSVLRQELEWSCVQNPVPRQLAPLERLERR